MIYTDFPDLNALKPYAAEMNKRARQYDAPGTMTAVLLRSLILDSAGRCAWCDTKLLRQEFEIDHIHPLRRGGANTYDNLALTCAPCNRRKGERPPLQFALEQVAANGTITPLIRRLLDDHDADATRQESLL